MVWVQYHTAISSPELWHLKSIIHSATCMNDTFPWEQDHIIHVSLKLWTVIMWVTGDTGHRRQLNPGSGQKKIEASYI